VANAANYMFMICSVKSAQPGHPVRIRASLASRTRRGGGWCSSSRRGSSPEDVDLGQRQSIGRNVELPRNSCVALRHSYSYWRPRGGCGVPVFRCNHTIHQQGAVGWVEHPRNPSQRPQEMGFAYRSTHPTRLLQGMHLSASEDWQQIAAAKAWRAVLQRETRFCHDCVAINVI
jgi:hypothetical protein